MPYYSKSKWKKYVVMRKSSALLPALPETRTLRRSRFRALLEKYGAIVVKPTGGWGGAGVMSVAALGAGRYEVHYGKKRKTIEGWATAYTYVKSKTRGREYVVQRKIPLARINGRPFDARVMVQRRKGGEWTVTGKLAKVAGAGYLVTNVARSGGRVVPLQDAIYASDISYFERHGLEERIDRLALQAASHLHKYYRIRTVGLDVGVDAVGKIWIIEANFTPASSLFAKLKDRSMYRRIISYNRG